MAALGVPIVRTLVFCGSMLGSLCFGKLPCSVFRDLGFEGHPLIQQIAGGC